MPARSFHQALIALCALIVVIAPSAPAEQWRSWTSFKDVRRLTVINDTLWAATSGGLLAIHDVEEKGATFTNVDGLGTTDLYDVISDQDGRKWLAGAGRLIRFDQSGLKTFPIHPDEPYDLLSLADDGDNLWIGAAGLLVFFDKISDGGESPRSHSKFGELPDDPEVEDVLVLSDTIWVAMSAGLAAADISEPEQLSPSKWITWGTESFSGGGLRRVVSFGDAFYIAASTGLWRLTFDGADSNLTRIGLGAGKRFTDLHVENDSLFFYYEDGMGVVIDSTPSLIATLGLPAAPNTGVIFGGRRWLAVPNGGLYYEDNGSYTEYPYTGLPANTVTDLTVGSGGGITAAFSMRPAATMSGDVWQSYDFYVGERTTLLISDSSGLPWLGTRGNGLWLLEGDVAVNYDEQNSTLIGNTDDPPNGLSWIVVNGLATDGRYLYAACYRAANGNPVAIGDMTKLDDLANGWSAIGAADGLDHSFVSSLDLWGTAVAVGNEFNGLYLCNVGDDPFDRPDNACFHFTENNSWLRSDAVRVVRFAPDGTLWAGTNVGLSLYDPGIERFVNVDLPPGISSDITDLEFDGRGNLWVGTRGGLARRDASDGSIAIYTTASSGLVADRINALTLDRFTGDLYIATDAGISILATPPAQFTNKLEDALAFPNPFVIRSQQDSLAFNYGRPATVSIFTAAGDLVWASDANRGWFGLNQEGEPVADGVYIYVLEDDEGNITRGKLLLVRE